MKNYKTKPFRNIEDAINFLHFVGYFDDKKAVDALLSDHHFFFRRWFIVIDPIGEVTEDSSKMDALQEFLRKHDITSLEFVLYCAIGVMAALWLMVWMVSLIK